MARRVPATDKMRVRFPPAALMATFTVTQEVYGPEGEMENPSFEIRADDYEFEEVTDHLVFVHFYNENGTVESVNAQNIQRISRE